jgi:hypothetical protein
MPIVLYIRLSEYFRPTDCFIQEHLDVFLAQMLDGLVKRIALDFDVENVAKTAKASKETKIAEVGADIELLTKQK